MLDCVHYLYIHIYTHPHPYVLYTLVFSSTSRLLLTEGESPHDFINETFTILGLISHYFEIIVPILYRYMFVYFSCY